MNECACQDRPEVPAAPTPRQLVDRVKAVMGVNKNEDLARALNVPLRSVTNWNSGKGLRFDTAIWLLDLAGWLRLNEDADERARTRRAEQLADQAEAALEELRRQGEP